MKVAKLYISPILEELLKSNHLALTAYREIESSILCNHTEGLKHFIINSSSKNCNGVVPIKEKIYEALENTYGWFREKPLKYLHEEAHKGGPIDVYKEFAGEKPFKVGLEFETGNISSAHRSMNKLCLGIIGSELDMAAIMLPIKK